MGLSSPSFYGGRRAVDAMKKKVMDRQEEENQSELEVTAKKINVRLAATAGNDTGFFPTAVGN